MWLIWTLGNQDEPMVAVAVAEHVASAVAKTTIDPSTPISTTQIVQTKLHQTGS